MNYFPKQSINWSTIISPIVLPLIYKDCIKLKSANNGSKYYLDIRTNVVTNEIPLTLYLASWQLSSLMIANLIEKKLGYEKDKLKLTDHLLSDLGADSLDLVEIALSLEKITGIPISERLHFERVTDLVDYVFSILIRRIQRANLGWSKADLNFLSEW